MDERNIHLEYLEAYKKAEKEKLGGIVLIWVQLMIITVVLVIGLIKFW